MQTIIYAFALQSYILWYQMILLADSVGPDQTARMRSLIWAFAVCNCLNTPSCKAESIFRVYYTQFSMFFFNI